LIGRKAGECPRNRPWQLACLTGVSLTFLAGLVKKLPPRGRNVFNLRWEIEWFLETKRFSHFGHWHSPPEAAGIDVFVTTGRNVSYHQQKLLAATSPSWPRQAPVGLTKHRFRPAPLLSAMDRQRHQSRDRARLKTVCNHSH
jgi:hypothetical protein